MSHPLYNTYASGNQSSAQGQYGCPSMQAERDPEAASSHLGPGSSFSSSSAIHENTRRLPPSLMSHTMNYRPEPSRAIRNEDIEMSVDMHINRAREEVRVLGNPMHQSVDQGTRFTSAQRDEFCSSVTGMASYPMSSTSASLGHSHSDFESGIRSLDWSANYERPTPDDSKFYSSVSSTYVGSGANRSNAPSKTNHDMQSIPGLGDYDYPLPDKPAAPTESNQPKYTPEAAADILKRFELDKEDLDHLVSLPDDQMTPDNLPFILRQLRVQKAKRATTAVQPKQYLVPQATRGISRTDHHNLGSSEGAGIQQEEMSSAVPKPSKVIDYGHTSKYTGGVGEDIGRTSDNRADSGGSGSMLLMDTYNSCRLSQTPLQKNITELKSSALSSSYEKTHSVTCLPSSYSSVLSSVTPLSNDQNKRLQTIPNQTSQTILSSFSLPKKDTDIRVLKPVLLKEPDVDCKSTSTTQPPCTLPCGMHPRRPGLVLPGRNDNSGTLDQSKTKGHDLTVAEKMKKQQTQQQVQKQSTQQRPSQSVEQQLKQQMQQQSGQTKWLPVFPAVKSVPPASLNHSSTNASQALRRPAFITGDHGPIVTPPAVTHPNSSIVSFSSIKQPKMEPTAKMAVSKGLPPTAMMLDYAATSPRIFPHTCSLCKKECTQMKDWISHQNTSLHLESCKLLRQQYPVWTGEIAFRPSAFRDAKPSPSTSIQTFEHYQQKTWHRSRSRSRSSSPRRHHSLEGRREKRSSQSRSPHSPRYTRRSRSHSPSPRYDRPTYRYRSRSRSPHRRSSPRRSDKRYSPPRRITDRRLPPRKVDDRRLPPRRVDDRRSPQRRVDDRRSPPRQINKRRSAPKRCHEGQSSKKGSPLPRKKSSNAEKLALQSLSKKSNLVAVVKTPSTEGKRSTLTATSLSSCATGKTKTWTSKATKAKPNLKKHEAIEREKNASKKSRIVEQMQVSFEMEAKEQKTPQQKKPATSSVSTPQTTEFTTPTSTQKILLPTPSMPQLKGPLPSGAKKATSGKPIHQKIVAKHSVKGQTTVNKAKVLVSKAKKVSNKQTVKLPAKGVVRKAAVKRRSSDSSEPKPAARKNQPDAGYSKQKQIPKKSETSDTKCAVVLKETAMVDKSENRTVTKPTKGKEMDIEDKILASKAETASPLQKPKTPTDKMAAALAKEKVEGTAAMATSAPSTSTALENSKPKDSNMTQEGVVVPKDTAEVAETADVTVFEPEHQAKPDKATDAEDAEPKQLGETGEVESCAEGEQTTTEAVQENTAHKPSDDQLRDEMGQHEAGRLTGRGVETKTMQEDLMTAMKTQTNAAPDKDASVDTQPTAAIVNKQQPTVSASSSSTVAPLAVGDIAEIHLDPKKIENLTLKTVILPQSEHLAKKRMLITKLGTYYDGCYTEEEVANLLTSFGFKYREDNIYVVPQMCMAAFVMPSVEAMRKLLAFNNKPSTGFKESQLYFYAVEGGLTITPIGFYKSLMKLMGAPVSDNGNSIIFITNISQSETMELKAVLKKISSVKNYLPLLNKVYIEFEYVADADALGVRYSLLREVPGHQVHRLNTPKSSCTSLPPRLPENAMPDSKDIVPGAIVPPTTFDVPQGSIPPFWIPLKTHPFLFPTVSPWFIIPDYLTVRGVDDIEKASGHGCKYPTIMLTNLPAGVYTQKEVAKLVWHYFPRKDLHSMYYNLTVLTLERRAFVHFADWTTCCDFVRAHVTKPVSLRGCNLSVHFVMQQMNPESSEEMMYRTLKKWSNTGVPELESLEDRLLCVEISEFSTELVKVVMEVVASITTFVSFLPLANRIIVEMADSNGVTQVLDKNLSHLDNFRKRSFWSKVKGLRCVKSLKRHLQNASEITINLGTDTTKVEAKPLKSQSQPPPSEILQTSGPSPFAIAEPSAEGPSANTASDVASWGTVTTMVEAKPSAPKNQTQPPPFEISSNGSEPVLQTSGPSASTIAGPITAVPSTTNASNVVKEQPGPEITMDSTVGPEANEDVEKQVRKKEEESAVASISVADGTSTSAVNSESMVPAASNPAPSVTALQQQLPQISLINVDLFNALKTAVQQHRIRQSESNRTEAQEDFTDDSLASDAYLFEEQDFNMDDFVTVDEVGDDVEYTESKPHSSSFSKSRRRTHRSDGSSGGKLTSVRSSRYSRNSGSFSTSSSKSSKISSSSYSCSVSAKKSKDSSELTKSPAKASSSSSISKPSSSSSMSTETPFAHGQKTQKSKMKSTSKALNTASSSQSTHPSSSAYDREKIATATLEASIDTHLKLLREAAKATAGAVTKSHHKVSAEGIAAKTVESETKTEALSEMQLPPQGHTWELSQVKSLEIDFGVNTQDQKKSKEEGRKDVDKHTEEVEEDGDENYQILDSLDDQTDEQMDDRYQDGISETQQTGPEEGQSLNEESYQVLDSEENEGKAHPKYSEMEIEMDGSFQVLDSVTEEQGAPNQDDSRLVQDDISTVKQPNEEDAIRVISNSDDKFAGKDLEMKKVNVQVLDTGSKQTPIGEGDEKKKQQKEEVKGKMISEESCKASNNVENPDVKIPNEDQPLQDQHIKGSLEDPDYDATEQEAFEVLDSLDDQTAAEDESQNRETTGGKICLEHIRPIEEEEDTYQVIDSLEDQSTTTETKSKTNNEEKSTTRGKRKNDGLSKRSSSSASKSKGEKSPKKQDMMVKKYETRMKMDSTTRVSTKDKEIQEATEERVYEIVDSVEDGPVQDATTTERSGRRRSARGKKEDKITLNLSETSETLVIDKDVTYKILDSIDDDTADDEPIVRTSRRTSRGKRDRTTKEYASSSKSTKGSSSHNSSSVSPIKSTDSSDHTKSPTKSLTSASVCKPSAASPLSAEILSSPGQKTQQSKTKSPSKQSCTTSSIWNTHSSAGREREMMAAPVKALVETNLELLREEAKATEGTLAKPDHKVAAVGYAVKSEREMETPPKMHLPPQGHYVELSQVKCSEMEIDGSFQVLDSVTEDQAALNQEDNLLVQDEFAVKDAEDKDQGENKANVQELDTGNKYTVTEGNSQNLETPSEQISIEDTKPIEEEEDTYQVVDCLEDQSTTTETKSETDSKEIRNKEGEVTVREDDGPSKRSGPTTTTSKNEEREKTPNKQDRMVKKYDTRTQMDTTVGVSTKDKEIPEATEEMVFEVVDSVEDETVRDASTIERTGRRRSARGKKGDKITLNLTEVSQKTNADEEATFEILDSVEDETADNEPVVTRSTRGKRERTSRRDASNEKTKKEVIRVRTRYTPVRQSQEKTPTKEEKAPPKESTPTKKSDIVVREVREEDAAHEIFDSMKDEFVKGEQPTTGWKGRRRRPKKEVETAKEEGMTLKKGDNDTLQKVAEEAPCQILDPVEDEMINDGPGETSSKEDISKNHDKKTKKSATHAGSTKNVQEEEERDPTYEIVDSLERDAGIQLMAKGQWDEGTKEKIIRTSTTEEASTEKGDTPTCCTTPVELSEKLDKCLSQTVDDLEEEHHDSSAAEESGTRNKESSSKTDIEEEDRSTTHTATLEKEKKTNSPKINETRSSLVNLDEVSEEEEDYSDDAAEEEELRKRQAATKEKQSTKEQEVRTTREREERRTREREEKERRSSSRGGGGGGGDRGGKRWPKERSRENEKVEVYTKELVTLDEVHTDEVREEEREWGEEITEEELEALVTLDEFVGEEEDGKAQQNSLETHPCSQEDQSLESLNPETLVTLDEAGCDEEEKPDEEQAEKTSRCAEHQQGADKEESMNFVTLDEVGEGEEEKEEEEEEEEVVTRTRSRAKKRTRKTSVRKSARGKKVRPKDETEIEKETANVLPSTSLDPSSLVDNNPPTSSHDVQPEVEKTEVEATSRVDVSVASGGGELQPEHPDNQNLEGGVEEGQSGADIKAASKQRRELDGPEPKRSRSQSPSVPADFELPPFKPKQPLGQEFVVPRSGFFCNACSVFYPNKSRIVELHCSSQKHYDNLQKYYQKLKENASRSPT